MDSSKTIFKNIFVVSLSSGRSIVASLKGGNSIWFNEYVESDSYTGYTSKGFGLLLDDLNDFIYAIRSMASGRSSDEVEFELGSNKKLVVRIPASNQVDIRQYITKGRYTGFTKKGLRLVSANAIKLTDKIIEYYTNDEPNLAVNEEAELLDKISQDIEADIRSKHTIDSSKEHFKCGSCGTVKRPHYKDGYCEECYSRDNIFHVTPAVRYYTDDGSSDEFAQTSLEGIGVLQPSTAKLERAFAVLGRRCYVCQLPYNKAHNNIQLYYADGDNTNESENNVYPICTRCLGSI